MNNVEKFTVVGAIPENAKSLFVFLEAGERCTDVHDHKVMKFVPHNYFIQTSQCTCVFEDFDESGIVFEDEKMVNDWLWVADDYPLKVFLEFNTDEVEVPDGFEVYGVSIQQDEQVPIIYSLHNRETDVYLWSLPKTLKK